MWRDKILAADCAVSLHVRHGDFATRMNVRESTYLVPIEYYRECVEELKKDNPSMTLFVFSDDLPWVKENLKFDVPMEFVEGMRDFEDISLISSCHHNICANSTFSWWGAWLNTHHDKKVFTPKPWSRKKDISLPSSWIRMPVDISKEPVVKMAPVISIVLVIHNDEQFIEPCLLNLLTQDFIYYEVVVIDDASTDSSFSICQRIAARNDKIVLMKIDAPIGRSNALNVAIKKARGEFIIFADVRNLMFSNVLRSFHETNVELKSDVFHSTRRLIESPDGQIVQLNRKFRLSEDSAFQKVPYNFNLNGVATLTRLQILSSGGMSNSISNNMFRRQFLLENGIEFERRLDGGADVMFLIKCLFKAKVFWSTPLPIYASLQRNPSTQDDINFDIFERLLKKYLSPIPDDNVRRSLELAFIKQYWNSV